MKSWFKKIDVDDGYCLVANGWLYALPKTKLTAADRALIDTILLRTYAVFDPRSKKASKAKQKVTNAPIAVSIFVKNTQLSERAIYRILARLEAWRVISINRAQRPALYGLNPIPATWSADVWKEGERPSFNGADTAKPQSDVPVRSDHGGNEANNLPNGSCEQTVMRNLDDDSRELTALTNGSGEHDQLDSGDSAVILPNGSGKPDSQVMTNGSGKPDQDVSPEQPVREQQPDPDGSNNLTDGSAIKDIEKRNKKKRVKPSLSSDKNSGEILFQIWNEHRGTLPKANALTANRKRHCRARIADNPDPDYWVRVVKTMATSSFLTGQNDRGWTADFDFLLKPDTHAKVSEGKYLDRHPKRPPEPQGIVVEAKERHGTDNPFT